MNASHGLDGEVTEWLRSSATADGSTEVLAVSLARAAQVAQEHGPSIHSFPVARRYVRPAVVATALAVAFMVVGVSSIPPLPDAASARVTGVWPTGSDVVFTASLPPDAPTGIYWRGVTYDTWSAKDRAWRVNDATLTSVGAGASILGVLGDERPPGAADAITVTIDPQGGSLPMVVVPGLPVTVDRATQIETSGPGGPLVRLNLSDPSAPYRVTAIPTTVDPDRGSASGLVRAGRDYPSSIRDRYATAPDPDEFGPTTSAFLRSVRETAGDDPYDIAATIVEAFQSARFRYVIDTRDIDCGSDGFTECFLRVKRGYCMYFATSMVMLLRHEGIPARFVEGFLPGERTGSQVTVRKHDAHAWVEVFFPGYGWVPFDPTPRSGPTLIPIASG